MRKRISRSRRFRSKKACVWLRLLCFSAESNTCAKGRGATAAMSGAGRERRAWGGSRLLNAGARVEADVLLARVGEHQHKAAVALPVGLQREQPPHARLGGMVLPVQVPLALVVLLTVIHGDDEPILAFRKVDVPGMCANRSEKGGSEARRRTGVWAAGGGAGAVGSGRGGGGGARRGT